MAPPVRITRSPGVGLNQIKDPSAKNLYAFARGTRQRIRPISQLTRVPLSNLRRFSRTVPGYSAIKRITDGVLALPWSVVPPEGREDEEAVKQMVRIATAALRRPNSDLNGRWRHLVSGVIDDLLVANHAYVERQPGAVEHPFWLWAANPETTAINPDWRPELTGVQPKFWDINKQRKKTPIMETNMFMMVNNSNTYEVNAPSPMEIAYGFIEAWLGLSDYQQATTSKATQEWLLDIGDVNQTDLKAFREYWQNEVVEGKQQPIVGGKGLIRSIKIGAANDAGLYHKYCEYLLRIITLAFSLTTRDANITEHDNRATAGVSSDSTFDFAVKPMAEIIEEGMSEEVIDFYLPGFSFRVQKTRPRSEAETREESRADFEAGIISRGEAREIRNLSPTVADLPPLQHELDENSPGDAGD